MMLRSLVKLSRNACSTGTKTVRSTYVSPLRSGIQFFYSTINPFPQGSGHVDLKEIEVKASAGSVEDMLRLGKVYMEERKITLAELWLSKAADNDNLEAQFLTGLLLTSAPETAPKMGETDYSDQTKVRDQIMKLRKESMFAKRSQSSNLKDFQAALKKRQEKLAQKSNVEATPASPSAITAPNVTTKELNSRALGLEWLQRAALGGHGQAMCLLGNELLAEGQKILTGEPSKDKKVPAVAHGETLIHQAINWYQLALTEGKIAAAGYNLGVLYHDGVQYTRTSSAAPVAQNPAPAAPTSVSSLSELMVTKVVHKKGTAPVETTEFYTRAADAHNNNTFDADKKTVDAHAQSPNLPVTVIPIELQTSLSYFQQAAALGELAASLWCGYCFSTGEGGVTQIDAEQALHYLLQASNHSSTNEHEKKENNDTQTSAKANYYLSQIYHSGLDEQLSPDRAKSLHYLQLAVNGQDEDALYTLADLHLQRHVRLEAQLVQPAVDDVEGDEEPNDEEQTEIDFLTSDLLRARLESVTATNAAAAAAAAAVTAVSNVSQWTPHGHSESCNSACSHPHDHNHDHNHQDKHDHNHDHVHSHVHSHDHTHVHSHDHTHNSSHIHSPRPTHPSTADSHNPSVSTESSGSLSEWSMAERSKQHLLRAVTLLVEASAAGQAQATLTLGALTYQGLLPSFRDKEGHVVDSKRRAFELYQLAAEQGSLDAWRNLASMHYLGDGVPKSVDLAKEIMKVVFGKK